MMKKGFTVFLVIGLLVIVSVSATALPLNCYYCGQPVGEYQTHTTSYETYRVPCAHSKYGADQVRVTYDIHRSFCNACHHAKYERWWEQSRTTTCQGWLNPTNPPAVIETVIK